MATLHTGMCQRCATDLKEVEDDDFLSGIAKYSPVNHMDPLFGLTGHPRLFKKWLYLLNTMTITESMLVALAHMQVSYCYFRGRRQSAGMPFFHKNIICFPQELAQLRELLNFFINLKIKDTVNVHWQPHDKYEKNLYKATVVSIQPEFIRVKIDYNGQQYYVDADKSDIERRVQLPWQPRDLRDALVIFSRCNGKNRNDYIDDLRVRRKVVGRGLRLLSKMGSWREGRGEEPLHMYYHETQVFDFNPENLAALPEDTVPEELNCQSFHDDSDEDVLRTEDFCHWLHEGKFAKLLAGRWAFDLTKEDRQADTFVDLFHSIYAEIAEKYVDFDEFQPHVNSTTIPISLLARWIYDCISLQHVTFKNEDADDIINEITQLIKHEVASVHSLPC